MIHDNVSAVLQTRDGYLWIGTDGGLSRFDGVAFTAYRTRLTPALIGDAIRCLFEDRAGILWIGTSRGLCRYVGGKFETVIDFDAAHAVNDICEDSHNNLWVATTRGLLRRVGDGEFERFDGNPLVAGKSITCVFADSLDRIWLGVTNFAGAVCYEHNAFRVVDSQGAIDGYVNAIEESPRGTLWFATRRAGLVTCHDGHFSRFGGNRELLSQNVSRIYADGAGSIWIGTFGIQRCSDDGSAEVETVIPLPSPNVRDITRDREGSVWVATFGDGLMRVRPSRYKVLNAASGLPTDFVRTVMQDQSGALFLAQGGTGAVKVAPDGTTTPLRLPALGRERSEALSVYSSRNGDVWLAMQNALYRWHNEQITAHPNYPAARAIYEDKSGTLWLGLFEGGVARWRNDSFMPIRLPEALAKCTPCSFAEGQAGTMYVATMQHGLLEIKGDHVTVINRHNGLPDDNTRSVTFDSHGDLWVGTKLGLAVFSAGRWWSEPWVCDTIDPFISDIVEIAGDNLLLSTSRGIVRVSRPRLLAALQDPRPPDHLRQSVITEAARTGNIGTACFPSSWVTETGEVWIAARKGAIVIDPKNIRLDTYVPPVRIEHLIVDGSEFADQQHVRLSASARKLEIDYTALTFVQPRLVRFSYRLEGYDDDWVDAGTRRVAFYNNLPPGDYTFHVKAANSDGVWNEQGASLTFTVPPLFYQTIWFRFATVVGIGAIALGLFRWRGRRLQRRTMELQNLNAELERRIAERTAELEKSFAALQASENFYQSLVESLPQVIFRKDTEGRFTYANSAFAEMIGHPLDRIIGRLESELYSEDEVRQFRETDERVLVHHETIEFERILDGAGPKRHLHVKKVPLYGERRTPIGVQVLLWDMTMFRETEARLKQAQAELLEASRLAGMAEVATGVLHNIGNALNSVNVSAYVATDRLRQSRVAGLEKVTQMLNAQGPKLAEFFAQDPRAPKITPYLTQLSESLLADRTEILREMESLLRGLDHLKQIVAAQQTYARAGGITEPAAPVELLEDALKISGVTHAGSIEIVRDFSPVPNVMVQRQQVLQVLVNLIRNAKDAVNDAGGTEKLLTVRVGLSDSGQVKISVSDNGVGIAPDNLTRIFAFGFTTKKTGHGFGLHSSALVAKELGGSLTAISDGVGQGATFVLELPPSIIVQPASDDPKAD